MVGQALLQTLTNEAGRTENHRTMHPERSPEVWVTPRRIKGAFSSLPSPAVR